MEYAKLLQYAKKSGIKGSSESALSRQEIKFAEAVMDHCLESIALFSINNARSGSQLRDRFAELMIQIEKDLGFMEENDDKEL